MKNGLLLVDLQNDYFPGGRMELVGMEAAAGNAGLLLAEFRRTSSPVIHVQHVSARPGAVFFLPGTEGVEIHKSVAPAKGEPVVVKNYPNAFRGTSLLEILKNAHVDTLVLCGAMTHMCIDATARAAFDFGFRCLVAEDACATRDLSFQGKSIKAAEVHAAFMAALSAPYAGIVSTRDILKKKA
jgi:nicotinamidase-related amidase